MGVLIPEKMVFVLKRDPDFICLYYINDNKNDDPNWNKGFTFLPLSPPGWRGIVILGRAGGCQTSWNAHLWNHWMDFLFSISSMELSIDLKLCNIMVICPIWYQINVLRPYFQKFRPEQNSPHLETSLSCAHLGRRVLSCPAASVHLSGLPSLPLYSPQYCHGFCSYSVQPKILEGAWTLLIMGFLCWFSGIQWHFENFWLHWLASWTIGWPRVPILWTAFLNLSCWKKIQI